MKANIIFPTLFIIFVLLGNSSMAQKPEYVFDQKDKIQLLKFSEDGKMLIAETSYDFLIYDTKTGQIKGKLETPGFFANSAIFSKDGKLLITGNNDGKVRVFDTSTLFLLKTLPVTKWSIFNLAISENSEILAADAADGTIELWDIRTESKIQTLGEKGQRMEFINFSPDDNFLAAASLDNKLDLFDIKTGKKIFSVRRSTQSPLIFCRQGKELAVTGYETIDFLSAKNGEAVSSVKIPKETVPFTPRPSGMGGFYLGQVIVSEDCQKAAIANWKTQTITLIDVKTQKVEKIFDGSGETSHVMAFSPDGEFIAGGSANGKVKLWRTK